MKKFTRKKRLDVFITAKFRDFIAEEAMRTGKHMNAVTDELLSKVIAYRRREMIEEQSSTIWHELLQYEVHKAKDQLLHDVREALLVEVVEELQKELQTSERRLVVLLVRLLRETSVA